jgi:hypothetical protein
MIHSIAKTKLHWNYFIALEDDLDALSRYIEFCPSNLNVFSIELAHLLFAAASEVDVVAKSICKIVAPSAKRENIDHYRSVLNKPSGVPTCFKPLSKIPVSVPRYGLAFKPWENWCEDKNPDWWRSYNNVKHERNKHFQEATLQNALNALGALLTLNLYYYRLDLSPKLSALYSPVSVTHHLKPDSRLLKLPIKYYDNPNPAP